MFNWFILNKSNLCGVCVCVFKCLNVHVCITSNNSAPGSVRMSHFLFQWLPCQRILEHVFGLPFNTHVLVISWSFCERHWLSKWHYSGYCDGEEIALWASGRNNNNKLFQECHSLSLIGARAEVTRYSILPIFGNIKANISLQLCLIFRQNTQFPCSREQLYQETWWLLYS